MKLCFVCVNIIRDTTRCIYGLKWINVITQYCCITLNTIGPLQWYCITSMVLYYIDIKLLGLGDSIDSCTMTIAVLLS